MFQQQMSWGPQMQVNCFAKLRMGFGFNRSITPMSFPQTHIKQQTLCFTFQSVLAGSFLRWKSITQKDWIAISFLPSFCLKER